MKYTLKLNIVVNIIKYRNKNSNGMKTISGKALFFDIWKLTNCIPCEMHSVWKPEVVRIYRTAELLITTSCQSGYSWIDTPDRTTRNFSEFICSNFLEHISPFCTATDTCFGLPAKSDPGFKSRADPFTWMLRHLPEMEFSDFYRPQT